MGTNEHRDRLTRVHARSRTLADRNRERLALRVRPERLDREARGGTTMARLRREER
jgi:hypothetical protein